MPECDNLKSTRSNEHRLLQSFDNNISRSVSTKLGLHISC